MEEDSNVEDDDVYDDDIAEDEEESHCFSLSLTKEEKKEIRRP